MEGNLSNLCTFGKFMLISPWKPKEGGAMADTETAFSLDTIWRPTQSITVVIR